MSQNQELLDLVKSLTDRIEGLEIRIKELEVHADNVSDDTLVAIGAAVAAYLGHRAKRRQRRYTTSANWAASTRRSQHTHHPLYTR